MLFPLNQLKETIMRKSSFLSALASALVMGVGSLKAMANESFSSDPLALPPVPGAFGRSKPIKRTRKIPYGETLRAHFATKNLTPERKAAHKAYVAKHARV